VWARIALLCPLVLSSSAGAHPGTVAGVVLDQSRTLVADLVVRLIGPDDIPGKPFAFRLTSQFNFDF